MDKSLRNYFSIIFLAIIWGSSFILMKRGLEVYDYIQVATLRIVIAFISLIPFLPRAFFSVKKKHLKPIIIMSILGNGIPAFLFAKAQTELDSSLVGILNSIVPLFTLIFGICFFKTKPSKTHIFGIIFGFVGALFLIESSLAFNDVNYYVLLVVLATILYSISINVIKKYLYDLDASSITAIAFLMIGPFAGIHLFTTDFITILTSHDDSIKALGYITLLSVLGTAIAVIIFNKLINNSTAIFASSVTYLIPVIAIIWGVFDGEQLTAYHIICVVIILIGVYLVNTKTSTDTSVL